MMRRFHSSIFSSLSLLAVAGCAGPEDLTDSTTKGAIIYQASHIAATSDSGKLSTLASVGGSDALNENCLVPDRDLNGDTIPDPVPIRTQMLIYRGSALRGVCTVAGSSGDETIYMTATGLLYRANNDPWGSSEDLITITYPTVKSNAAGNAGADYAIPANTTSTLVGLTSPQSKVKEYYNAQAAPQVLYTWPHLMESGMLAELDHHAATAGARTWEAAWAVQFNAPNTYHPFINFHITSTNIGASFPQLWQHAAPGGTKLPYAVSYHAHGSCANNLAVRVGGADGSASEKPMHRGLAEIIHLYTYDPVNDPTAFASKKLSYHWGDCFDGGAAANFVNNVPASTHGIQLEQSFSWINTVVGATTRGKKVVNAVRSVFDCLAESADATAGPFASGSVNSGGTAAYASGGICPGFIGDLQLGDVAQVVVQPTAELASCSGGGKVHADFYRLQTNSGVQRWRRIGGGRVSYDVSCNLTREILDESTGAWATGSSTFAGAAADWTVAAGTTDSFRAVVRGFDASGNPAAVTVTLAP